MRFLKVAFILIFFLLISCNDNSQDLKRVKLIYSILKVEYAPDKNTELFDIQFNTKNDKLVLTGEVTTLSGYYKIKNSLSHKHIKYKNKVRVLPDSAVGKKYFAVAKNSVINLKSQPTKSAKLISQSLLGMSLRVFDKKDNFYKIQTPDKYISWADKSEITRMTKQEFINWKNSEKVIFTQNFGHVFIDSTFKQIISDITLGGTLKLIANHKEYYKVEYPDKRKGFIKKHEASTYKSWINNLATNDLMRNRQNNIETVAKSMDGFPYLWKGTSTKGMDASGFTKMVYLMNGFIIPRDISQQFNAGKTVDTNLDFSNLGKGDLLFFGEKNTDNKKPNATHIGIWLGNEKQEFIHAIGNDVHLSSMDKNNPLYDDFYKNTYLKAKCYLGVKDKNIIDLKEFKIKDKNVRKFIPLYKNISNTGL